jgi:predicted enzyme related to lactoylglutathione lyase
MPRPVHFEIHADDPDRAVGFYTELFGWTINRMQDQPYWLITTGKDGPGIDGGLLPRQGSRPAADAPVNGFVCTVAVDDLAASVQQVTGRGGDVAVEPHPIPGVGRLAYVRDTEGNLLGLLQPE